MTSTLIALQFTKCLVDVTPTRTKVQLPIVRGEELHYEIDVPPAEYVIFEPMYDELPTVFIDN